MKRNGLYPTCKTYKNTIKLTELLQHLVALVQDEVLQVLEVQLLAADKGEDPARGADHDVRAVGLEHLLVLADGESAEEDGNLKEGNGANNSQTEFEKLNEDSQKVGYQEERVQVSSLKCLENSLSSLKQ